MDISVIEYKLLWLAAALKYVQLEFAICECKWFLKVLIQDIS